LNLGDEALHVTSKMMKPPMNTDKTMLFEVGGLEFEERLGRSPSNLKYQTSYYKSRTPLPCPLPEYRERE
jgi:hypothetical protein